MIAAAEDAAKICKERGQLSHDFGHSTDKCNLAMNSADLTMEKQCDAIHGRQWREQTVLTADTAAGASIIRWERLASVSMELTQQCIL